MNLKLKIWRQESAAKRGGIVDYEIENVTPDSSFLKMLDLLNEKLIINGEVPVAFDHDCREGICGMCSLTVNGIPHGPERGTTVCQLHMRHFKDGDTITIEPWRAAAFPIIKDLVIDRSAFEKIQQAGGFIAVRTGSAPEANEVLVPKAISDWAMDNAACIGCGACVAACKNSSAMLFTASKVAHLNALPQGKPEKDRRALKMVMAMDEAGFGNCTNYSECAAVCPKEISLDAIAQLNRDYGIATLKNFFGKVD